MRRLPTRSARDDSRRADSQRSAEIGAFGDARLPLTLPLTTATVLQLQRSAGNAATADLLSHRRLRDLNAGCGTIRLAERRPALPIQRAPADAAVRAARALAKRLLRSGGVRGAQLLYRAAGRRALARLQKLGIDKAIAAHIGEHFVMIPEKVAHSVFVQSLRSTKAVTAVITETLKKGAASPVLSVTDSGALAWVIEAELGRTIGHAGKQALTKMRVVVDLKGRLVTAFPIKSFVGTLTIRGLGGLRATLSGALSVIVIQGIYENEAAAATQARQAFDEANEPSWWEYLIPWGPSSTIGYEPDHSEVAERAASVADQLEKELGEPLDAETRAGVEADVRSIWNAQPATE